MRNRIIIAVLLCLCVWTAGAGLGGGLPAFAAEGGDQIPEWLRVPEEEADPSEQNTKEKEKAAVSGAAVQAAPDLRLFTEKEIEEGLALCRAFPVYVQVKGKPVETARGDAPPVILRGRTLIPARAFFEAAGAQVEWDNQQRLVTVKYNQRVVEIKIDSTEARVDGQVKKLEVPALILDHDKDGTGSTMVPLRFVSEGLGSEVVWINDTRTANIFPPPRELTGENTGTFQTEQGPLPLLNDNARKKLVVIDIGHGGSDTGAIAGEGTPQELYEKDVNLAVGLKLKEYLEKAGMNCHFTRLDDASVGLRERPRIANELKADVLVSIHNNSSDYSKPNGTEVHYYTKVSEDGKDEYALYGLYSRTIADLVQKELLAVLNTFDRGIKESPKLAVLRRSSMPAIIVEGAFLSNEKDLELIRSPGYAEKYAYAVARGLVTAMNRAY